MTENNVAESRAFLETSTQKRREGMNGVAQRRLEAPSTPGRPFFRFSVGSLSRKSFPSKWDDAEKWVIGSSCNELPAHLLKPSDTSTISKENKVFQQQGDVFAEKFRITEEKVSSSVQSFHGSLCLDPHIAFLHEISSDVLKDNVDSILPTFKYLEPMKEGFLFKSSLCESMKDAATEVFSEIHQRDIGTEMTPLGSSTTSRCHTPLKISSPARHNTPADRSGPLMIPSNRSINISELQECHFGKVNLVTQFDSVMSNWSSREEEEEEISKSLRHFDMEGCRKSVEESRASLWADEQRNNCCMRYQREEAKIQAWVNLQNAKAEAQSRKLEVKIQKMKSNLEEKLMKRMTIVHRRAEEWRAAAQEQHSQHIIRASERDQKMKNNQNSFYFSEHASCGCFPCNNHL